MSASAIPTTNVRPGLAGFKVVSHTNTGLTAAELIGPTLPPCELTIAPGNMMAVGPPAALTRRHRNEVMKYVSGCKLHHLSTKVCATLTLSRIASATS